MKARLGLMKTRLFSGARLPLVLIVGSLLIGCKDDPKHTVPIKPKPAVAVPDFDADSAYQYVQNQVDFGPRVPNTPEHSACAEWLESKLIEFGADVIVQEAKVRAYDGTQLDMKNIIGQFDPENKRRILLFAHWDTRPWADKDNDESRQRQPILGANDAGSGVGVLLEVARQIGKDSPDHGIDIIFFDSEDYGTPEFSSSSGDAEDWCLGSQFWCANPHKDGYRAKFGILLDMVGSKTASFPKEGTSMYFADWIVNKVWNAAKKTGHSSLFNDETSGATTDDHLFVNREAGIPSACIVEYHISPLTMGLPSPGYGSFHHTHNDNMDIIDKESLRAVGETLMHVIYNE